MVNTTGRPPTNGLWSKKIDALQERICASPLKDVQKMELNSMVEEMVAKGIAYDLDSVIKMMLVERVKDSGLVLLKYEADLVDTQGRLADLERSVMFHKKVLSDAKASYINAIDPVEKDRLLELIDSRESTIKDFDKQYAILLDLRNKIRKETDKKKYQEKSLVIKEKEVGANVIDVEAIDW